MDSESKPNDTNASLETLEGSSSTIIEPDSKAPTSTVGTASDATQPSAPPAPKQPRQRLKNLRQGFNIYLLGFVLIMVIAIVVVVVSVVKNRKAAVAPSVTTQTLTQKQLEQLANSDVSVGNSKQVLNVQSNAVFAGQVLIHQNLEVAGTITAGGSLNLPGITVSGTSTFAQIQTGNLTVSGSTSVQGQLTASGGLNVAGTATFAGTVSAGTVTVNALTLNGDLKLDHHIAAGGPTPGRTAGSALGGGGTAALSGSDTAGTVNINTGSGPSAGCFITINFATKFNATPHVVVTPVGSAAAGLSFYVDRSTTSMSICTTTASPASTSFAFDYIAFD